ncbi:pancreatic lipase-related protein 2-like isoform X1 [Centruroides sculpturatus]|uniref:pancreatic lipase-related protein 2-like isoform X1 n=1 Tax=Centruroides sculpturatus TaxID=218467 RepID=UPI000C6EF267|nr:pancreatic lipase-related protein 2-like isoform X1 [Centruroides sculpturatus]XP_023214744.1 pancreatic lipase-related protein 2-like isoform X1 [Centruroides sculpturatus]
MNSMLIVLLLLHFAIYGSFKKYEEKEDIRFLLYTRKNPMAHILVVGNNETLITSNFDPIHATIFLVHGYMTNVEWSPQWREMRKELLNRDNFNVIVVDWLTLSSVSYEKAASNAETVGKEVANLIKFLKNSVRTNPVDVHIIGHGIGAHIAGFAGKKIKVGRITGLDPAVAYFKNVPSNLRLDKSDAYFVDVIHTDIENAGSSGLGTSEIIGHVDFFPNNGNDQPNCRLQSSDLIKGASYNYDCDHNQALTFFINSINKCNYVGIKCPDWIYFLSEKCLDCGPSSANCALMGFNLDHRQINFAARRNVFFLKTSMYSPFCGI